jgi:hypothetical protein
MPVIKFPIIAAPIVIGVSSKKLLVIGKCIIPKISAVMRIPV